VKGAIGLLVLALVLQSLPALGQEPSTAPSADTGTAQPAEVQPSPMPSAAAEASQAPDHRAEDNLPDSPSTSQSQALNASQQPVYASAAPVPAQEQQDQSSTKQQPVGTAAAETIPTTGVAASRPAGAAYAPAKQRQVRSFLIKMGAVIGAGVAIGTVIALSAGSPSKPPGAR